MFKVFQIHISGGCCDDCYYYDYIDSSYLNREKAEKRVKELQDRLDKMCEQAEKCDYCEQCDEDCYVAGERDDDFCKNFVDYPQEYYDNETYTIVEREVIE